ncbi:MAG: radical SAM protein [Deltaproteobacteria bacterium]|nr:radical SAM protein [Deltaproteobacteria bacterium]
MSKSIVRYPPLESGYGLSPARLPGDLDTNMSTNADRRAAADVRAREAFGADYLDLAFPSIAAAAEIEAQRHDLLEELCEQVPSTCSGTKIAGALSPGCAICAAGKWSCLFINECCNARCFYCPTSQDRVGEPMTNGVPFSKTEEYLEYLARFGFSGVSISGGEPLMTLDRTLDYLTAIRRRFGEGMHTWLYTNGTLLDASVVRRLRDAGLDEIRFDIGATNYSLDKVPLAVGVIQHVTVELPAIPEDLETLTAKLAPMSELGVDFLNLHQLRLTPHNLPQMIARGYTFAHGEQITVLDSEVTALRVLAQVAREKLSLAVNYCSFLYKSRFQGAAARRRGAQILCRPHEDVTASGYIRQLRVTGSEAEIAALAARLNTTSSLPDSWSVRGEELTFVAALWPLVQPQTWRFSVAYTTPCIVPAVRYRHPFIEIPLGGQRKIAAERVPSGPAIDLSVAHTESYFCRYLSSDTEGASVGVPLGDDSFFEQLHRYECIEDGLQDYY